MAEIVAAETPTGVVEVGSVAEIAVVLEVVEAEDLEDQNPASQLDVTSVEIHVRFPLNQTEVSRSCAEIVSRALTEAVLIENHRLMADDSKIALKIAHDLLVQQVQLRLAQA